MNKKQKLEIAKWAVKQAQKNGANEAAVNISKSRRIEIEVRDNHFILQSKIARHDLLIFGRHHDASVIYSKADRELIMARLGVTP